MRTLGKILPALLLASACAHAPAPGSYKASPEPLPAEGSASFDERDLGASRERAALDAERNAVRRAAELFLDETERAEKYAVLEIGLLKTPQLYVAKRKILSEGREGASYRVGLRAWVYHDKIAAALRTMNLAGPGASALSAAFAQRAPQDKAFAKGFRDTFARRSAILIKDYPFASDASLLAGPDSDLLAAAAGTGADLLFAASASAARSGAGLSTGFYPSRSEATLKVYDVKTGKELLSLTSQANAIDSSEAASFSKALSAAGELLAQDAAGKAERLLKADAPIRLKVIGLAGLEAVERLKVQLQRVDARGVRLESYADGAAVFTAVPRRPDPQEFASAVLRGDALGLELEAVGPQEVVFSLPR